MSGGEITDWSESFIEIEGTYLVIEYCFEESEAKYH